MRTHQHIAFGFALSLLLTLGTRAWAEDDLFSGSASASGSASGSADSESPGKKDDDKERKSGGGLKIERPLLLTRHTMELGGEITIAPAVQIYKGDVDNKADGGGKFSFSPKLGYFVIDKLELLLNFGMEFPFGTADGFRDVTVGFGVGARYFFDFNIVALYVGGTVGPKWLVPDNPNVVIEDHFNINVMVGILVPMNRHVGIDLGMRMNTDIRIDNDFPDGGQRARIDFPIGYLGISGFFNFITGG